MTELERHPQAARQGAAAIAVVAFTAAGMPAMAMRAEAQRDDADWAAWSAAFTKYLDDADSGAPAQRLAFQASPRANGWRAQAVGLMAEDGFQRVSFSASPDLRDTSALAAMKTVQPEGLRAAARNAREQRCLAEAIYYEARGESRTGQMAVAEVVMNRVRSSVYPDTICGVVYQGSQRDTGCQFSFTCDGSMRTKPYGRPWREANAISTQMIAGQYQPLTHRATHYHTTAVDPYWNASLIETTRIGAHVFYRFPSKTERAYLAAARRIPLEPEADAAAASAPEADFVQELGLEPAAPEGDLVTKTGKDEAAKPVETVKPAKGDVGA